MQEVPSLRYHLGFAKGVFAIIITLLCEGAGQDGVPPRVLWDENTELRGH